MSIPYKRYADVFLFVGFRKTGKTSVLLNALQGKKVLFLSYSPMDEKMRKMPVVRTEHLEHLVDGPGIYRVDVSPYERRVKRAGKVTFVKNNINLMLADINKYFFDGHVVFDDIFPVIRYNPSEEFMTGMISCRHNGNDCYFIFHNANNVAPFVYEQVSHFFLFKTGDVSVAKSIDKIARSTEALKMITFMNSTKAAAHDYCYMCCDPTNPDCTKPFEHVKNTH